MIWGVECIDYVHIQEHRNAFLSPTLVSKYTVQFRQLTFGASAVSEAFLCIIRQTIVFGQVVQSYGNDFQEDRIFRASASDWAEFIDQESL